MPKDAVLSHLKQRKRAAQKHAGHRDAWVKAFSDLIATIQGWLSKPIKSGLLVATVEQLEASDPVLGRFEVPGLTLEAPDGERIFLRQLGPDTKSGLFRAAMSSEHYAILLAWDPGRSSWMIADDDFKLEFAPLTKRAFDRAFRLVLGL